MQCLSGLWVVLHLYLEDWQISQLGNYCVWLFVPSISQLILLI